MYNKKAIICQPMNGKTKEEILIERDRVTKMLNGWGYEVVDSFVDFNIQELTSNGVVCIPLYYLATALSKMAECHAAFFCKGWEDYRGCLMEHYAAEKYGLELIYEMDTTVSNSISNEEEREIIYHPGSLRLIHDGAYIARFYISWDEVMYDKAHIDTDGTVHLSTDSKEVGVQRLSWSRNGDRVTSNFDTVIRFPGNIRNLSITAQSYTALFWKPWITSYKKEGLEINPHCPNMTLKIYGTSLSPRADMIMN